MEEFIQNIEKILMYDKMLASDRIEVLKFMFERKHKAEKKQRKNFGERSEPPHQLLSDVDSVVNFTFSLIKHLSEHDPYPEDIFIKPTEKQMEIANKVLTENGINTAGYNGSFAHHVRNVMIKEIAEYLDNWRDK